MSMRIKPDALPLVEESEAAISRDAPAARAALARNNATDLADMLGIGIEGNAA